MAIRLPSGGLGATDPAWLAGTATFDGTVVTDPNALGPQHAFLIKLGTGAQPGNSRGCPCERLVRASPLLTDAAGNVLDILDPPFALAGIAPSPMEPVSYQVFVTALAVQPIPGTHLGTLVHT